MRFTNIIFDFDGTLTDSRRDIAGAQLWAFRSSGFDDYREEDLYRLIGKPLQETFASLLPRDHHGRIPDAIALYAEYYPPRALDTTILFPGVRETLTALRSAGAPPGDCLDEEGGRDSPCDGTLRDYRPSSISCRGATASRSSRRRM